MGEECKRGWEVEIQPMSQERRHGGGKPGRASVNCSPDSGGMHSLIGVIDTPRRLRDFFVCPKGRVLFPFVSWCSRKGNNPVSKDKRGFIVMKPHTARRSATGPSHQSPRLHDSHQWRPAPVSGLFSLLLGVLIPFILFSPVEP